MTSHEHSPFDVLVCGRGLSALQTALDFVEVGLSVVVAAEQLGDTFDAGPEFDHDDALQTLMHRLATSLDAGEVEHERDVRLLPREVPCASPMLRRADGTWLPQSTPNVFGIPAVTLSSESLRLLGGGPAARAYLDRITPLMTVGKTRELGVLVKKRLGSTALEQLVEPQILERYGRSANEVEVAMAAPGLNEALTRSGALTSAALAYSDRHRERECRFEPATGWRALRQAAVRRLELYGALFIEASIADATHSEGEWQLTLSDGSVLRPRAVVVENDSTDAAAQAFEQFLKPVAPQSWRMHSETDIHTVDWLSDGGRAVTTVGDWSVSIEQFGLATRVRHASKVVAADGARQSRQSEQGDEVLALLSLEKAPDSEWRTRSAAAPFASVAERDAASDALAALRSQYATLLPVGRALHGDDESASLAVAHREAVHLRRRLLGLEN